MGKTAWVSIIGACCVISCGQDLALPDGYGRPEPKGGVGPAEGTTGPSGAGGVAGNGFGSAFSAPVKDPTSTGGAGPPKGDAGTGGVASRSPADERTSYAGEGGALGEAAGEAGIAGEAGQSAPPPAQLLFSEYVEGLKSNKALELFALQGGSLDDCELQTFFNGKTEPSKLALQGELATGQTYVLCSSDLGKSEFCSRSTNLTFNGDDALALSCQGVIQDVIGQIGVDPGESWGMGATLDHTLQRRCGVTAGRSDPTTPFVVDAEWVVFGADTFSDLGQRRCESLSRSKP